MAWIDDRIWCHPKASDLTDRAFRVWVNSLAYSSGMETGGTLTPGMLKLIGSTVRSKEELIGCGLWDELDAGLIYIHNWQERNWAQAERKRKARERMRAHRAQNSSHNSSQNSR